MNLRLYLVTDTVLCGSRGVAGTVEAAISGGVTVVQLRDPAASGTDLFAAAVALREILRPAGIPFIVNDRLDVALAARADGVHLGQSDLPVAEARRIAGPDFLIGLSVSTVEETEAARESPVDYLGVGPVYATPTKADAAPALGLDGTAEIVRTSAFPTVAIGGINTANAAEVAATGVDGLCVVSAICAAPDPAAAARELEKVIS
ncbi:MAG TPA: thiamine phosphate synthase [Mycobacteriales bacterium]|nr:thiamine phosphate synthase [Mycobacteriales bacterium]